LNHSRYQEVAKRLRGAGFDRDKNENGNPTHQRWLIDGPPAVTVDFLIDPGDSNKAGGTIWNLEPDFAAVVAPGLQLAFLDRLSVNLSGKTIRGERTSRNMWVSRPGAFVVLKSLAFRLRGENKDAYDLVYVLREYGDGLDEVLRHLAPLLDDDDAQTALAHLDEDFAAVDSVGPMRYAEFVTGGFDDDLQADALGGTGQASILPRRTMGRGQRAMPRRALENRTCLMHRRSACCPPPQRSFRCSSRPARYTPHRPGGSSSRRLQPLRAAQRHHLQRAAQRRHLQRAVQRRHLPWAVRRHQLLRPGRDPCLGIPSRRAGRRTVRNSNRQVTRTLNQPGGNCRRQLLLRDRSHPRRSLHRRHQADQQCRCRQCRYPQCRRHPVRSLPPPQ